VIEKNSREKIEKKERKKWISCEKEGGGNEGKEKGEQIESSR
jgi:hypothetical protein